MNKLQCYNCRTKKNVSEYIYLRRPGATSMPQFDVINLCPACYQLHIRRAVNVNRMTTLHRIATTTITDEFGDAPSDEKMKEIVEILNKASRKKEENHND